MPTGGGELIVVGDTMLVTEGLRACMGLRAPPEIGLDAAAAARKHTKKSINQKEFLRQVAFLQIKFFQKQLFQNSIFFLEKSPLALLEPKTNKKETYLVKLYLQCLVGYFVPLVLEVVLVSSGLPKCNAMPLV